MQVSPNMGSSNYNTIIDTPEEPLLPSYEAAMDILDTTKLPRYRRTFSARFHPYRRPRLKNFDERDRLFNTIFDEEGILLNVPTVRRRGESGSIQIIDDGEATQRLIDIEQTELRLRRLDLTIVDFVDGVRRAHIPQ